MSHYFESGFFTRQEAWHGLGNVLPTAPATPAEALEVAGLNWDVKKKRMFFKGPDGFIRTELNAIIRATDSNILGYAKKNYVPYQNIQAAQWCRPLIESELWTFEAGGSLKGGEHCWFLLKQDEHEIVPNDVLKNYLLFMWNHTGRKANIVRPVTIRVVCWNTLTAALNEEGLVDKVYHSRGAEDRYDEIQRYYQAMTAEFTRQHETFDRLLIEMNSDQREAYCETLIPLKNADGESFEGRSLTTRTRRLDALKEMVVDGKAAGAQELGIVDSAYGAFQAASEFFEHYDFGQVQDRGDAMLYGIIGRAVDKALGVALEFATVKN